MLTRGNSPAFVCADRRQHGNDLSPILRRRLPAMLVVALLAAQPLTPVLHGQSDAPLRPADGTPAHVRFSQTVPSADAQASGTQDPLQLSLVFVGDFQIGYANWLATKGQNPSSTNVPQLRQTMLDIEHLHLGRVLGVFTGDLVMNMIDDMGQVLEAQLNGWQATYASLAKPEGMPLLPMAGNHEIEVVNVASNATEPSPFMYDVWLKWNWANGYARYSGNGPRPTGSNPDWLVRDERDMTYSFDVGRNHFVVINTDTLSSEIDPVTRLPYAGWIPIHWIERDIAAAQNNPRISAIVVIGHRPIEAPSYASSESGASILNTVEHPLATRLSETLWKHGKVRVYLCSHAHTWQAFRLQQGKGAWQVLAGNGGAELDAGWQPEGGQYFGFSILNIYQSGTMTVLDYGRPLPTGPQQFFEDRPEPPPPATLRQRLTLTKHEWRF